MGDELTRGVTTKPGDPDWRENVYTGPGMPTENAQRQLRDGSLWHQTKEFAVVTFVLLSPLLALACVGLIVWDLFLR